MLCLVLVLVCSMSISAFAVNRIGRAENEITQSVQMTDNQKGEAAATRQKSSEVQTKTKQENMKKSDSESKTKDNSEEQKKDSKDADNKGAKENSTEKDAKEDSEKNTSKEEKSTKEEKNTEKKSEEITDASEATTAAEEKTTEAATERKDSKEATSEEKASEETQAEDDKNKEIAVTSISEPTEAQVVETTTNITAAIYFLATPDGVPESNETKYWAPESDKSKLFGKIDITNATWQGNKNIVSNVSSHIMSWPDNSTAANWVINKGDSNFGYILDSIWERYKTTIENQLGVKDLRKEDVTQITLKPFKISKDNSFTENQNYHIDCTIDVKCNKVFTAKFWVKNPGKSGYKLVDAKNYITGNTVEKTKATIDYTKVEGDLTYVFDGWYPEDANGGAYDSTKTVQWNYSPSDAELADGTVNFYAHYSPTTTSIKLKKLVTGNMGDRTKKFHFTISITKENEKTKENENVAFKTVDLANNEESTLTEIPVGADVSITEDDYSGSRYTTSYVIDNGNSVTNREANMSNIQATKDASAHEVVFTNKKDAIPDTGITLDSLPFITLLALSIAGGIFYLICRYKKRFV